MLSLLWQKSLPRVVRQTKNCYFPGLSPFFVRAFSSTTTTTTTGGKNVPSTPPDGDEEPMPESGEWAGCRISFLAPLSISVRGPDILQDPLFNKGTAFKSGERDRLRFRGLLPARILNIHLQKERFLMTLRKEESNIKRNIMLEDLHDRNETLYHRVLVDHIEEMAPLIYTPTVGQACQEFATRFRRSRGMYFTEDDRGHMAASKFSNNDNMGMACGECRAMTFSSFHSILTYCIILKFGIFFPPYLQWSIIGRTKMFM